MSHNPRVTTDHFHISPNGVPRECTAIDRLMETELPEAVAELIDRTLIYGTGDGKPRGFPSFAKPDKTPRFRSIEYQVGLARLAPHGC